MKCYIIFFFIFLFFSLKGQNLDVDGNVQFSNLNYSTEVNPNALIINATTSLLGKKHVGYYNAGGRQTLSISGTNLAISNGNVISLSSNPAFNLGNHIADMDLVSTNQLNREIKGLKAFKFFEEAEINLIPEFGSQSPTPEALDFTGGFGHSYPVRIGSNYTTPSDATDYKLVVDGTVKYSSLYQSSDRRFKQNINLLENVLPKIKILKGYSFKYTKEAVQKDTKERHLGVIAQEIQSVFPEIVKTRKDGYLTLDYLSLTPVLLQAISEQLQIINNQKEQIEELEKFLMEKKQEMGNGFLDTEAKLFQNKPNPFSEKSFIEYFVPTSAKKAYIIIYNMDGEQLKLFDVMPSGKGEIIINANEIKAGMYLYSLIIDEKLISTKRMIITA